VSELLTQDEIDSLLQAVRQGEVPTVLEGAPRPARHRVVLPYDFRRPNRIAREQVRALQMLHDNFARGVSSSLSGYLRTLVEVQLTSVEQVTYGDYMSSVGSPSALGIFEMSPLSGGGLLDISLHLLFPMIDRILGGPGRPAAALRELTEIERALVDRFYRRVLSDLQQAWGKVGKFIVRLLNLETNAQFIQLVSPNDIAMLIVFDVRVGTVDGMMSLCLPLTMLEPILPKLVTQRWFGAGSGEEGGSVSPVMQGKLYEVPATVRAITEPIWMSVGQAAALQVGDVLPLAFGRDISVRIEVEGHARFVGRAGRRGRRRAVEITRVMEEGGLVHA
jgi:flagellar motor switch protein FliM